MSGKPTIDDIARLAGVSKATVSRVLNRKPDVDPLTRERILRIVEEQNFVPSIAASNLARGKSRLIGVLIPSFTQPFIQDVMRGVAETIEQTPYELVLYSANHTVHDKDKSHIIDNILATKLTAGVLAMFLGQSMHHLVQLHKNGFPVVVIDDQELPDPRIPWVGADNRMGGYEATRHLIGLGHRRIAHIQGPMRYLCSREREQGYMQALAEAGLSRDERLIMQGDFQPHGGRVAANSLFSLPVEQRPTAIFASNDQMAYGVLAAAEEHGLHIPGELLSLLDLPLADVGGGWIAPMPSTSGMQRGKAGEGTRHTVPPIRVQFATSLVVRTSCGSPHHLAIPTSNVSL